ncbi:MAG: TrpB-like pyridoxal phosphate-dependent enzyme [Candidatus Geothermarchaeales archaeon]
MTKRKVTLDEEEIPLQWYNIQPDLPKPIPPPIDPKTQKPADPKVFEAVFAKELVKQEVSQERWIDIPEEVRTIYRLWRPTPLIRALRLEEALKTPAKIYYKYEGVSPPGSHKPNTAVAQVYYNMKEGMERLTTETGAGQWGSALAFGCTVFNLKSTIYMVRASYEQKPYRKSMMQSWGAEVFPSPSERTKTGKNILKKDPDCTGSLGIAISEAVEDAVTHEDTNYTLGSVVNHVLMHQTVIGLEAKKQFNEIDEYPDILIGCVGGGSSFSGLFWPFYYDKVSGKAPKNLSFLATEPTACPTLTRGPYTYDHGDTARFIPLVKMYTLGHDFVPPPIHSGGLRYHGDAPSLCLLINEGIVKARAYNQVEVFDAANLFAKTEGTIPAPEPAHAIKATIDEALRCKETGVEKIIMFLLCGHGYFDMQAYDDYFAGKLPVYEYPEESIKKSLRKLKRLYPWVDKLPY